MLQCAALTPVRLANERQRNTRRVSSNQPLTSTDTAMTAEIHNGYRIAVPLRSNVSAHQMATVSGWHIPLGLIALGTLFLAVAWLAVAEYWRAFRADPHAVMSLEVLAN